MRSSSATLELSKPASGVVRVELEGEARGKWDLGFLGAAGSASKDSNDSISFLAGLVAHPEVLVG